jgi:hypothetical protein
VSAFADNTFEEDDETDKEEEEEEEDDDDDDDDDGECDDGAGSATGHSLMKNPFHSSGLEASPFKYLFTRDSLDVRE